MSIDLDFLSTNIRNTTVVDSATGEVLFDISTPSGLGSRTTTIKDDLGKIVGEYERHWSGDKVTVGGKSMKLSDWMPRSSLLSGARKLQAPDGKVYVWRTRQKVVGSLKLVDHATKHSVGKAHATHHPSGTRGLSVEFDAALEPILDELVLSFVICEEKRRDSQQSNMGQASGAVEEW